MDVVTAPPPLRSEQPRRRRPRLRGGLLWLGPIVVVALVALSVAHFLRSPSSGAAAGQPGPGGAGGAAGGVSSGASGAADAAAADVATREEATRAHPDDPKAWQQLGAAYLRQAIRTSDPAYYQQTRSAFDTAAKLAPGDPATWVGQGALSLSLHRFDEALAHGQQALGVAPDSPDALGVIVDAQVELGRYDDAGATLQRMLDMRPSLAALARTSYLRELHGDLDGALVAMVQAEAAGGGADGARTDASSAFDVATVVTLQGDVLWAGGHVDAAADRYRRALDLAPDLPLAVFGQARARAAQGHTAEAIDTLQTLVARIPLPAAAALLGDLQAASGKDADAQRSYDLVRLSYRLANDAGAVTDLEQALFDADHGAPPASTVEEATRAEAARPTVYAADAMAWALHRAGDDAAALPHVEEALHLGTPDAQLHAHAAVVLASVGQTDRATAELRYAVATNARFTFTPAVVAELSALARRLGVAVPAAWSTS